MLDFNELYFLFKHKLLTSASYINLKNAELKTNAKGQAYVLYNLTNSDVKIEHNKASYVLDNHHLSFYEMQNNNKSWLSQYHYTAALKDAKGNSHSLHVYFNQKDEIVRVTFNPKNSVDKNVITLDGFSEFSQLARTHSVKAISTLRQQALEKYEKLEQRYEDLEITLTKLSQDLIANRMSYMAQVKDMIEVLTLLMPHHKEYQKICNLYKRTQIAIETISLAPIQHNITSIKEVMEAGEATAIPVVQKPHSILEDLLISINVTKNALMKAKAEKSLLIEQAKLAQQFFQLTNEAFVTVEEKKQTMALPTLLSLQQFSSESIMEAKKILISALFNLKAAEELRNFAPLLSPKYILLALKTNNHDLLDFLLSNGQFSIDTLLIDGVSPALYCFKHHKENNSKEKCLSVLMKHHASILTPAEDGLPLAHHILKDSSNALNNVLRAFSGETIHQSKFYTILCKALEMKLAQGVTDSATQCILEGCIKAYRSAISELNFSTLGVRSNIFMDSVASNTSGILKKLHDSNERVFLTNPRYKNNTETIQSLLVEVGNICKKKNIKSAILSKDTGTADFLALPDASASPHKIETYYEIQESYIQYLHAVLNKFKIMPSNKMVVSKFVQKEILKYEQEMKSSLAFLNILHKDGHCNNVFTREQWAQVIQKGLDDIKGKAFSQKIIKKKENLSWEDKQTELSEILELFKSLDISEIARVVSWLHNNRDAVAIFGRLAREDILDFAILCETQTIDVQKIVRIEEKDYLLTTRGKMDKSSVGLDDASRYEMFMRPMPSEQNKETGMSNRLSM